MKMRAREVYVSCDAAFCLAVLGMCVSGGTARVLAAGQ